MAEKPWEQMTRHEMVSAASRLCEENLRLRSDLDAATSFKFNGPTERLGDYVLVDYYDEDDGWHVSVHTCETRGMLEPIRFKSRHEAIAEARRRTSVGTTEQARCVVVRASAKETEAMTNKESAERAAPYTFAEVAELAAWSQQDGWSPTPETVHRLLATMKHLFGLALDGPFIHKYRPHTAGHTLCGVVSPDFATTSADRKDTTCPACLRAWIG
jgi:hypothetical protein